MATKQFKFYHLACIDEIWCYDIRNNTDTCVDKYYNAYIGSKESIKLNKKQQKWVFKNPTFHTYEECEKYLKSVI